MKKRTRFLWLMLFAAVLPLSAQTDLELEAELEQALLPQKEQKEPEEQEPPLYVKLEVGKQQKNAIQARALGISLFAGKNREKRAFKAGESTDWIELTQFMKKQEKRSGFCGVPIDPYNPDKKSESYYTLYFSKTPSMDGLIRKVEHMGPGLAFNCKYDPVTQTLETDEDWSAKSLAYAQAVPEIKGKRPQLVRFDLGFSIFENRYLPQTRENELKAQSMIGANGYVPGDLGEKYGYTGKCGTCEFIDDTEHGCLCEPAVKVMDDWYGRLGRRLKATGLDKHTDRLGVMDEPAFGVSKVMECVQKTGSCKEKFRAYLKANGITPEMLGKTSEDELVPTRDDKDPPIFYWTVRYRNHVNAEFYRTITNIVHKHMPYIRTGVNIATELVCEGNMVQYGMDWYEVYNSGALTFGQTEDWSNLSPTKQISGYISDVMRSACRKQNIPSEMLCILGGDPLVIQAKAFTEIGHGFRSIGFFRYGPKYTGLSDSQSERPEIFEAIKRVTFPTGAVEEHLMRGNVLQGDAAMLLSVTGDIHQILHMANPYGWERQWLHLLLSRMSVRLDILSEEDLADPLLKNYRQLFVTEAHIRKAFLQPLKDWVSAGGTLILTPGALTYDEYGKPLGFDAFAGLERGEAKINYLNLSDKENDFGTLSGNSIRLKNGVQSIRNGEVFLKFFDSSPAAAEFKVGKGKVIFLGFMPGRSYAASFSQGKIAGMPSYDESMREVMAEINRRAGIRSAVLSSDKDVEVCVTDCGDFTVLTLSCWAGEERTADLTYDKALGTAVDIWGGELLAKEPCKLKVKLQAGCHILLKK